MLVVRHSRISPMRLSAWCTRHPYMPTTASQQTTRSTRALFTFRDPSCVRFCFHPGGFRSCSTTYVAKGRRVTLAYEGKLDDGTVFDDGKDELTFVCGEGAVLAGFHDGIIGMQAGDTREIVVEPMHGYGEHDPERVISGIPLSRLPEGAKVGDLLQMGGKLAELKRTATVVSIEDTVTLDMNHPLAGKTLLFNVKVISVEDVPKFEPSKVVVETKTQGDGVTFPKKGDMLTMHYTGTLAGSGAVFDSSHSRGVPFTFAIGQGQVIAGWDEGVMRMSLGEHARLKIPAALGYGPKGVQGVIPPNSDLIFDVQLININ